MDHHPISRLLLQNRKRTRLAQEHKKSTYLLRIKYLKAKLVMTTSTFFFSGSWALCTSVVCDCPKALSINMYEFRVSKKKKMLFLLCVPKIICMMALEILQKKKKLRLRIASNMETHKWRSQLIGSCKRCFLFFFKVWRLLSYLSQKI